MSPLRPNRDTLPALKELIDRSGLKSLPMSVSARHCHLTRESMDALFGPGSELTVLREISQPGQFAANQQVTLRGPKGDLTRVRVIGPLRKATQVEISLTEARAIGMRPPLRNSGDLDESQGAILLGPHGDYEMDEGVIIAWRHVHMTAADAAYYQVADGDRVSVYVEGARPLCFDDVVIRIREDFALDFQIDTDEGNACGHEDGTRAWLLPAWLSGDGTGSRDAGKAPEATKLITEDDVLRAHREGRTLWAGPDTIITPSAQDADRRSPAIKHRG